ncbi:acyl-CoA dehydrogenase FadE4 domain protein [Mycobacterium intracellulare 1956]|uniref:Acyl-CoA dehydrogenase FadE4 domain protein n=1 Tax=Mycobacterium intracellulare 1956 TaxID=1299331 RepID=X8CE45_MYCIT|nr:acyl-CoA dehydrogenase FadE4 domain protein [Mycobacterium intracellulare 1956]
MPRRARRCSTVTLVCVENRWESRMLLNPNHLQRQYPDRRSAEIMAATVDFFESRARRG